jgi:hypothetical protein
LEELCVHGHNSKADQLEQLCSRFLELEGMISALSANLNQGRIRKAPAFQRIFDRLFATTHV